MTGCRWLGEGSNGGRKMVFGTRFLPQLENMLTQSENSTLDVFAGPNLTPHADPILTPYLS